jgi:O-succinylbenzoic acid--CoA ligase
VDDFDIKQIGSDENIYLIPKYIAETQRVIIQSEWEKLNLTNHIFILSSGTTKTELVKTYAISKKSLLNNAAAVNEFLNVSKGDCWISSLPHYHIGGLSIYARAFLSESEVVHSPRPWNPSNFYKLLQMKNVNYFSVVPTQLYDLVQLNLKAPSCVKGVFVGGDFLSTAICSKALSLGWPIISTFGMTETCSQFASSFVDDSFDGFIKVLPINSVISQPGCTVLNSTSLYTAMIVFNGKKVDVTYSEDGFIKSLDLIDIEERDGNQYLKPKGRLSEEFKVNGRLVNFLEIKNTIYNIFDSYKIINSADIQLINDERKGKKLLLIIEKKHVNILPQLLDEVLASVGHLMDVDSLTISELELTASGKIKKY